VLDNSTFQNLWVVLVATRNPLNMGAVARAMSNFGFRKLRVVQPYDAAFREARSAIGAEEVLTHAEEYATVADAVADCRLVVGTTTGKKRELRHVLHDLKDGAVLIARELSSSSSDRSNTAVLFGSEKRGLSNEDLSHCHWLMRIPTHEQQPSMNLGQAVAVCLYELKRERATAEAPQRPATACSEDLERLTELFMQTLRASGYMDPQSAEARAEDLRSMVRRLNLPAEDTPVWMGMLRQILWKLKSGG
jgi:TrmH family RNA methyltransferase